MLFRKLIYCLAFCLVVMPGCGKRQNIGFTGDSGKAKDTGVKKDQMAVSDYPSWDGGTLSDTIKWDRGRPKDLPAIPDTGPLKPNPCKDYTTCYGYACDQGKCRISCYRSSHCAPTHTCNGQGKCVKKITCTDDKPCATPSRLSNCTGASPGRPRTYVMMWWWYRLKANRLPRRQRW